MAQRIFNRDLTNQRFGKLTVLQRVNPRKDGPTGKAKWLCKCDCGNEVEVLEHALLSGNTKSCGCLKREKLIARNKENYYKGPGLPPSAVKKLGLDWKLTVTLRTYEDLTGRRFGRLVVLEEVDRIKYGDTRWKCQCDCGNIVDVGRNALITGKTKSCGCYSFERKCGIDYNGAKSPEEYELRKRLHKTHAGMISRCTNSSNDSYAYYGARGITVCEEWMNDREAFYQWALSHGYQPGLTIDRIDSNGPYSPENCRWATKREQNNNLSTNVHLPNGQTVAEYCREHGIRPGLVYQRLQAGWDPERACTEPPHSKKTK